MKKIGKMNEVAWILGILLCALGVSLSTKAGLGLSMVAAPPYIIHIKLAEYFSWYTQGTSEYIFQTGLLILLCILIRKFNAKFLLSFLTALLSGIAIDGWLYILGGNAVYENFMVRIIAFAAGEVLIALAIAFCFRTSMPLQIYELFVKEVAIRFNLKMPSVKMVYDFSSLAVSVVLALLLNKNLQGIGIGTIIVTFVNAPLIKIFGKILDRFFTFESAFLKAEKV